jgi:hypothetical protein
MYIIAYCGYEGIEAILWAGENADQARERIAAFRERCSRIAAVRESKRWGRIAPPWDTMDEPDRVCVLKEGAIAYTCCCRELSVSPSSPILM